MRLVRGTAIFGAVLLCLASGAARADGLADLKTALTHLQASTPLKATVDVKTWRRQGEGREADERQGQARVELEDGARGLAVWYGKDLISHAEAEARAQATDKQARTPTLTALRELDAPDLRTMSSAAAALAREIDEGVFKGEAADTLNGKSARRLSFEMPIERLPDRDRKYLRDFNTHLDVWIAADGTPLSSRLQVKLSGRAFVVVSFEQHSDELRHYMVVGDRLLTVRTEAQGAAAGAGERQEYRTTKTLQLAS